MLYKPRRSRRERERRFYESIIEMGLPGQLLSAASVLCDDEVAQLAIEFMVLRDHVNSGERFPALLPLTIENAIAALIEASDQCEDTDLAQTAVELGMEAAHLGMVLRPRCARRLRQRGEVSGSVVLRA